MNFYCCQKLKIKVVLKKFIRANTIKSGGEFLMEESFNVHLGRKLRMRRLSLGLTQTKVAQAINVTFQQIQKYEKGTNGVSSNRLMQLSEFLKVPIIYFFEDFKDFKDIATGESSNEDLNYSFLSRTFSSLSRTQKEKILQILSNTSKFEKVG